MSFVVNWTRLAPLLAIAACGGEPVFRCERDEQCMLGDVAGTCEPSGYCSSSDPSCDGRRYAESAGEGLAGVCLHVSSFGETSDADFQGVTTDAELESMAPTMNFGGSDNLTVQGAVGVTSLLRFDLARLPIGAIVDAAELRAHINETGNLSVELFPLTEAWDELTVTWTDRTSGVPWATAGAGAGSRSSALLGMFVATPIGPVTAALDPAAVQVWLDAPSSNHGFVLMTRAGTGATMASSQEDMTSRRPHLVITWR